jgi:nicotinamide mononucleotide (NMN) deamidase PncC
VSSVEHRVADMSLAAAAAVAGPDGTPGNPKGVPVFAWKGETGPLPLLTL